MENKQDKNTACGSGNCGCKSEPSKDGFEQVFDKTTSRRGMFKSLTAGLLAGAGLANSSCSVTASGETKEKKQLEWEEYFKGNYRLMTRNEKGETVKRLERLYELNNRKHANISTTGPVEDVLYG